MSLRPRIGVTTGYSVEERVTKIGVDYTGGVEEAGGLPLALAVPYRIRDGRADAAAAFMAETAERTLDAIDGLLLTGGGDLDPEFFDEGPIPGLGRLEPARDVYELALARAALERGLPILGICRGIQVLAVAAGGDLYQDLPSQRQGVLKHRQEGPAFSRTHFVDIEDGSLLSELLGVTRIKVNSRHHQAVRQVPEGFRVSAVAPDGVIEAIEATGPAGSTAAATGSSAGDRGGVPIASFRLGLQWHPENLWLREPLFLKLFSGLVDAAREHGRLSVG